MKNLGTATLCAAALTVGGTMLFWDIVPIVKWVCPIGIAVTAILLIPLLVGWVSRGSTYVRPEDNA